VLTELLHIVNDATLQSRRGKDAGAVDRDALAAWSDATLGGDLAGIALAMLDARGLDLRAAAHGDGREPAGPPSHEAQARAVALVLVSGRHARRPWEA
jgi:hypothetical protein